MCLVAPGPAHGVGGGHKGSFTCGKTSSEPLGSDSTRLPTEGCQDDRGPVLTSVADEITSDRESGDHQIVLTGLLVENCHVSTAPVRRFNTTTPSGPSVICVQMR